MAGSSEIYYGTRNMADSSEIFPGTRTMEGSSGIFPGTRNMEGSSEIFSWNKNYGWQLLDVFLEQQLWLVALKYFPGTRTMTGRLLDIFWNNIFLPYFTIDLEQDKFLTYFLGLILQYACQLYNIKIQEVKAFCCP